VRITSEQTVADSVAIDGERKTVTALFADIKGSMELIEDLDPEEARAIVDPALKLMIDAVHRYEGYVAQSTGDGIFALFGAPIAHEDHPQRALHAARRMQEDLKRYGGRLRERGQPPLSVRVGINSEKWLSDLSRPVTRTPNTCRLSRKRRRRAGRYQTRSDQRSEGR
jgi:class 3 adenylate cyclase